jgi:1,4-dihydroxy-2-naphthoate octaprenyltransferase
MNGGQCSASNSAVFTFVTYKINIYCTWVVGILYLSVGILCLAVGILYLGCRYVVFV